MSERKLLAQMEAFLIKALKLVDVLRHARHLHWTLRADAHHLAFVLKTLHHLKLTIVSLKAMAEQDTEARIVLLDEMRNLMVASRIAIATVARKHQDVTLMTKLHST